jgi:hypothetical protein
MRGSWIAIGAAGLLVCSLILFLIFDDRLEGDEGAAEPANGEEPVPVEPDGGIGDGAGPPQGPGPSDEAEGRPTEAEQERRAARGARRAYRRYIAAIDAGDGAALCAAVAGDLAAKLRPAVKRGSCADRIGGSVGYEDPRGFPVWEGTSLTGVDRVTLGPEARQARITASIVTLFRDRTEPSIESDIAYLANQGGRWILLKPTGALYRAVGKPEPPPSVIAPAPCFEL